jgi:tRNA pseudouridine38-40 synthase
MLPYPDKYNTMEDRKRQRYMLHLSYLGKNYHGWQSQPRVISVQSTIEAILTEMLKIKTVLVGCGRTDSGVNALQYFAHFDSSTPLNNEFLIRLNKRLPPDIAIYDIFPVQINAHSRYDAVSRGYTYYLHTQKHPVFDNLSAYYPGLIFNTFKLEQGIHWIADTNDFFAFCRRPSKLNTTICNIHRIQLSINENQTRLKFEIQADRFITGMIRLLMSKLIEYNNGKLTDSDFRSLLNNKSKMIRFNQAYPQGLYLTNVQIPYLKAVQQQHPMDWNNLFAPIQISKIEKK